MGFFNCLICLFRKSSGQLTPAKLLQH